MNVVLRKYARGCRVLRVVWWIGILLAAGGPAFGFATGSPVSAAVPVGTGFATILVVLLALAVLPTDLEFMGLIAEANQLRVERDDLKWKLEDVQSRLESIRIFGSDEKRWCLSCEKMVQAESRQPALTCAECGGSLTLPSPLEGTVEDGPD